MNTDNKRDVKATDDDWRVSGKTQKNVIAVVLSIAASWGYLQFSVFGVIRDAIHAAIAIALVIYPLWWMSDKNRWPLAITSLPLMFGPMAEEAWISFRF